jgi:hypothetical protein
VETKQQSQLMTDSAADAKERLLSKYEDREPHTFEQYDGWDVSDNDDDGFVDDVMVPDKDDLCITRLATRELMRGPGFVRVLIEPGSDPKRIALTLRKIAGYVERDGVTACEDLEAEFSDKFTMFTRVEERLNCLGCGKEFWESDLYVRGYCPSCHEGEKEKA